MLSQAEVRPESGHVEAEEAEQILFPEGLVGCPSWRRFVLLPGPPASPIMRLQCLSEQSVCFVVTDPRHVVSTYEVGVSKDELLDLGLDGIENALVFCTLSIRGEPAVVTANLLAPLVINPRFRVGKQVVLAESGYSTRHPVVPPVRLRADRVAPEGE